MFHGQPFIGLLLAVGTECFFRDEWRAFRNFLAVVYLGALYQSENCLIRAGDLHQTFVPPTDFRFADRPSSDLHGCFVSWTNLHQTLVDIFRFVTKDKIFRLSLNFMFHSMKVCQRLIELRV